MTEFRPKVVFSFLWMPTESLSFVLLPPWPDQRYSHLSAREHLKGSSVFPPLVFSTVGGAQQKLISKCGLTDAHEKVSQEAVSWGPECIECIGASAFA